MVLALVFIVGTVLAILGALSSTTTLSLAGGIFIGFVVGVYRTMDTVRDTLQQVDGHK
jgi:uncharacterized membrane protein